MRQTHNKGKKLEQAKKIGVLSSKSLKLCEDSIVLDPKNAQAYVYRGSLLFACNKHAEAKKDLLEALELEPGNKKAQQLLKKIKYKTGEYSYEIKDKSLYNSGYQHKLIYSPR